MTEGVQESQHNSN